MIPCPLFRAAQAQGYALGNKLRRGHPLAMKPVAVAPGAARTEDTTGRRRPTFEVAAREGG